MYTVTVRGWRATARTLAEAKEIAGQLAEAAAPRPPRLQVRAELQRAPGTTAKVVKVKRQCDTGRYLPRKTRANACGTAGQGVRRGPFVAPPKGDKERAGTLCFRTRGALARAFRDENSRLIQLAGGLDLEHGFREFDSVNEAMGLKGRRRVTTLGGAILASLPRGRPFCHDAINLDALNDTTPARELGAFTLPSAVEEARLYARYLRDAAAD